MDAHQLSWQLLLGMRLIAHKFLMYAFPLAQVNVWLDHQKAANGGQPAGTPQSASVVASTPVQGSAAAAAAVVGAAVASSAIPSGTVVERSISATLSPDEPAQPGNLATDSTPEAGMQQTGPEANGLPGSGAGARTVRSAVRALEFGEAEPRPEQGPGSSPLSDLPASTADGATGGQENGAEALDDGAQRGAGEAAAGREPGNGAVSVAAEPARSLPPDARLDDAATDLRADPMGGPADAYATMADNAAELRALLTMHRAEMRVASEQLRAQFEAGQVQLPFFPMICISGDV